METLTPIKTGAANNRGNSKQDYETPWEFIRAVEARYGALDVDFAASIRNAKAPSLYTEEYDSLSFEWNVMGGLCWLNPPFGNITPWAEKCALEASKGARILFLVPASIDSNWWNNYVRGKAWVDAVSPRI